MKRRYDIAKLKLVLLAFGILISNVVVFASEEDGADHWKASLEISSKHVWRGLEFGNSPVLFPQLSYTNGGFWAYAMGGYATNGTHQEVDFGVSCTLRALTLGVNDYYYPSSVGASDTYFDYSQRSKHWVELYATYQHPKVPFWCMLSSFVYGPDRYGDRRAYSTYLELGYAYALSKQSSLVLSAGISPNRSFYNGYERASSWSSLVLKYTQDIRIGGYTLPISASYIFNPSIQKSAFSCSIILQTP